MMSRTTCILGRHQSDTVNNEYTEIINIGPGNEI